MRLPENLRLGRKDHAYTTFIPPDEIFLPEDLISQLTFDPCEIYEKMGIAQIEKNRRAIMKAAMSSTLQHSDTEKLEEQLIHLRAIDSVLKDRQSARRRPRQQEITADFVAEIFRYLYKKMPHWCNRLTFQAHNWGLRSSTWSESGFSQVDKYVSPRGELRSHSDLVEFSQKIN